jgi:hypothetical protein
MKFSSVFVMVIATASALPQTIPAWYVLSLQQSFVHENLSLTIIFTCSVQSAMDMTTIMGLLSGKRLFKRMS